MTGLLHKVSRKLPFRGLEKDKRVSGSYQSSYGLGILGTATQQVILFLGQATDRFDYLCYLSGWLFSAKKVVATPIG